MEQNIVITEKASLMYWGVLVILIVSMSGVYGLPHVLWLHDVDWDYRNTVLITPLAQCFDNGWYMTQIKEIYEGNLTLANPYIVEYKHDVMPLWRYPFSVYIVAFLGKFFQLPVPYFAVLMDFLVPVGVFLCAVGLLNLLGTMRWVSLFSAFILVMTPHVGRIEVLRRLIELLWSICHVRNLYMLSPPFFRESFCYECFSRKIHPSIPFLFLLITIFFLIKGVTSLKRGLLGGAVFFGILTSYSYVYFSTYLYAFLGCCGMLCFLFGERRWGKTMFLALFGILGFSLPVWYSTLAFSEKKMINMAYLTKHFTPVLDDQFWVTCGLCIIIVLLTWKQSIRRLNGIVTCALLASGAIICQNQQVVTGRVVESDHYTWFVIPQMTVLACGLLVAEYAHTRQQALITGKSRAFGVFPLHKTLWYSGLTILLPCLLFSPAFVESYLSPDGRLSLRLQMLLDIIRWGGITLALGCLCIGILLQWRQPYYFHVSRLLWSVIAMYVAYDIGVVQYTRYVQYMKPKFGYMQQLMPALRWLETQTKKESVVLGMIAVKYGPPDPPYISTDSLIPIYTDNNLYITQPMLFYLVPSLDEALDRLYTLFYFMGVETQSAFESWMKDLYVFKRSCASAFDEEKQKCAFIEYQKKLQHPLYQELMKYRLDYIFYGPEEQKFFTIHPDTYSFLQPVYDDRVVKIYQVRHSKNIGEE